MIDLNDTVTQPLLKSEDAPDTPRWLHLLRQAVQKHGHGGVTKVAACLVKPDGRSRYSRMYVSQFINVLNVQPASPDFQKSVITAFGDGRIDCPHLQKDIAPGECHAFAAITWVQVANTGFDRLDHWRACQDCLQNPTLKGLS